jgi:hypothetical protein
MVNQPINRVNAVTAPDDRAESVLALRFPAGFFAGYLPAVHLLGDTQQNAIDIPFQTGTGKLIKVATLV